MKKIVLLMALLVAAGCSESSPKMVPFVAEKTEQSSESPTEFFRPVLDILFIIDDSGSMGPHQQNLSSNAVLFADAIVKTKFLDYHVGVINSSVGNSFFGTAGGGQLFGTPKYVERRTPNGLDALAKNLIVGTNGDATEMFFDPLYMALTDPILNGFNQGFIRQDAYMALIFVTDTDDQSKNFDAKRMYDFLLSFKGSANKIFVGAAYIPDADSTICSGESEINSTDNLPEFFNLTRAMTFSLCDPDFGDKLAEIGRVIASKAQTMYLKKIPKQLSIKVSMGGKEIPNHPKEGWTYNPVINAIEFGAEIDWVNYPDNAFPEVQFEAIQIEQPDTAGQTAI